jgi:hypothetical protein
MNTDALRFGIELECEVNGREHQLQRGNYHRGLPLDGDRTWRVEQDSSLRVHKFGDGTGYTAEIVSKILKLSDYKEALKKFEEVLSKEGTKELNEVLNFNESCGAHIHFSFINHFHPMYKYLPQSCETRLHDIAMVNVRRLHAQGKISQAVLEKFIANYYRGYAKKWVDGNREGKMVSLNAHKENRTFEWRSFNLTGIETWSEFHAMIDMGVNTVVEFLTEMQTKGYTVEKEAVLEVATTKRKNTVTRLDTTEQKKRRQLIEADIVGG